MYVGCLFNVHGTRSSSNVVFIFVVIGWPLYSRSSVFCNLTLVVRAAATTLRLHISTWNA